MDEGDKDDLLKSKNNIYFGTKGVIRFMNLFLFFFVNVSFTMHRIFAV